MSTNQAKPKLSLVPTEKTIDETSVRLDNVFDLITKDKEKLRDSHALKMQSHVLLYAGFLTDIKSKVIELNEKSASLVQIINDFCSLMENANAA